MSLTAAMLQEFTHEAAITQRVLERLPDAHMTWKPHAKSWTLGELSSHIANIPTWTVPTVDLDELAFDPASYKSPYAGTRAEVLAAFEENVEAAKQAFGRLQDAKLMDSWALKNSATGDVFLQMPRGAVLRAMVMNHLIHHRGQLAVYLRLKDVPLPSIYGPSADES